MGDGPPGFPQDFPCPVVLGYLAQGVHTLFAYGAITLYGRPFQTVRLRGGFVTPRRVCGLARQGPPTPDRQRPQALTPARFGLLPFRSPLLRESRLLSFPGGTEMFHFPPFASAPKGGYQGITPGGFPHSGIPGSQPATGSPGLIAGSHALHRLPAPRHPPHALSSLTAVAQP